MRRVAFALVLIAGTAHAQPSDSPVQQGQRIAGDVLSSWKSCLVKATDAYSHTAERADTVAEVALNKCSEWDPAVKKALTQLLAVKMTQQMPFDMALKLAEDDAHNTLRDAKARMKLNLRERIMDRRSAKRSKAHGA